MVIDLHEGNPLWKYVNKLYKKRYSLVTGMSLSQNYTTTLFSLFYLLAAMGPKLCFK